MKKIFEGIIICVLMVGTWATIVSAQSISVTPVNGGSNLDFGSPQNGEAVTKVLNARITNSTGQTYQIFHEIVEDVVNEQGVVLPSSAFKFHTVFGSNSFGTLYVLNETPVPQVETLIYDSDAAGTGDAFKISYTVYSSQAQENGNYHGRIRYTFRTEDGAFEAVDEIDVTVNIQVVPQLSGDTSSGGSTMSSEFNPTDPTGDAGFVKINFDKNFCHQMQIIQAPETLPINSSGKSLEKGSILFSVLPGEGSGKSEVLVEGKQVFEPKQVPIFQPGSTSGSVVVKFHFNPDGMIQENAGKFESVVKFLVVCDGVIVGDWDAFLGFVVEDIFKLTVIHKFSDTSPWELPTGEYVLGKDMEPGKQTLDTFILKVETNQPFKYMVTQEVPSLLTHTNGTNTVPASALTESTELYVGTDGCTAFEPGGTYFFPAPPNNMVVPIGNAVNLFLSDNNVGRCISADFVLTAPAGMKPGDYYAPFYYTLAPQ